MPSYLLGGGTTGLGAGAGGNCCCTDTASLDRNSALFFNNLATKLLEMSETIQKRMEDLANRVPPSQQGGGVLFASIETPAMALGVKMEYVEYIRRYGPPIKGKFDTEKLAVLRAELGISENDTVI